MGCVADAQCNEVIQLRRDILPLKVDFAVLFGIAERDYFKGFCRTAAAIARTREGICIGAISFTSVTSMPPRCIVAFYHKIYNSHFQDNIA